MRRVSGIETGTPEGTGAVADLGVLASPDEAEALVACPLFSGTRAPEAVAMLSCLGARRREYDTGERVMRQGDPARLMGLVLRGELSVERVDVWGTRSILTHARAGDTFADAYACAPIAALPVDVVASKPSVVLTFEVDRVLTTCSNACAFHSRVIRNLLNAIAIGNLRLSTKINVITPRTIRSRLSNYLAEEAARAGRPSFEIGMGRQELADYLCCDRSALCHELSKMRDEGLIDFDRNTFKLLVAPA